jgi:hypothetical protein
MDIDLIGSYLQEKLTTVDAVNQAAAAVGVSRSTMYRLKSNPSSMQLGQLVALTSAFGMPVDETFSWLPTDFLAEERHRLHHEVVTARVAGTRMSVTPFFTVHAELPEVVDMTAIDLYEARDWQAKRQAYHAAREDRKTLYFNGSYESREIINGHLYANVFFARKGRYMPMSEETRDRQVDALVKTLQQGNVQRRIYLGYDLPIITWFSINVALMRVGEFSVEVKGARLTKSIEDVFNDYFSRAHLKSKADVEAFLRNPSKFIPINS